MNTGKIFLSVGLIAAVGVIAYQAWRIADLNSRTRQGRTSEAEFVVMSNNLVEANLELARTSNALAAATAPKADAPKSSNEVLKLRGEVGRLRTENAEISSTSPLSKFTANPESRKMLRDQQKLGMGMLYGGFTKQLKLEKEQSEQFLDTLADHIMANVDNVTTALRDKLPQEEVDKVFARQDATLNAALESMLGPEAAREYQSYSREMLSRVSADQFKGMLSGDGAARDQKARDLRTALQEEVRSALASANLPEDYQMIPMLNFRNIASETAGEQSLKLLDSIYEKAAGRARSFLSPDELSKFQEFRSAAIKNNRTALQLNRTMMAPIGQ